MASILLVDDNKEVLSSYESLLEMEGFDIACASNGKEALSIIEGRNIDIILSDLKMPEMNGLTLLEEVRKFDPHVGFIILTAFPSVKTSVRSIKEAADDYLEKPIVDFGRFIKALDQLFEKVKERREAATLKKGQASLSALEQIEALWNSISPQSFTEFIREEQLEEYDHKALHTFLERRMNPFPHIVGVVFNLINGRLTMTYSKNGLLGEEGSPCRRRSDNELIEIAEKEHRRILVRDLNEGRRTVDRDSDRRDKRVVLIPFSIGKEKGYVLFQGPKSISFMDDAFFHLLTELAVFCEWLNILNADKIRLIPEGSEEICQVEYDDPQGDLFGKKGGRKGFLEFIGSSPKIQAVYNFIKKIAHTEATILILGETGTGKELAARTIHRLSGRKEKPFMAVNCASLSESLLESELFGYEKGAFTGADRRKKGLFEAAEGGTLFLDEIGDISPALQSKLLRVLQNKEIIRVGGNETIKVDVRIVTATNKNLLNEVAAKKFREDLYYRIDVLSVTMPPLRERGEDIRIMIDYFVDLFSRKHKVGYITCSREAMGEAMRYRWPGNVRELISVVERAVIISDGRKIEGFPFHDRKSLPGDFSKEVSRDKGYKAAKQVWLEQFEREYLTEKIDAHGGNVAATAKSIGVDVKTIWRKIKQYGLKESSGL